MKFKDFGGEVHGCFTPSVFSSSGGMGKATSVVFKHLANLLSIQGTPLTLP